MAFGVQVTTSQSPQSSGTPVSTGTAFVVGVADQGPTSAVLCHSTNDYVTSFGPRSTLSAPLYDWLDTYFGEQGQAAYVARDSDGTASSASLALQDAGPHPSVVVTALTPGVGGNSTYVAVTQRTAATFTGTLTRDTANVTAVSSFANIGVGTPVTGTSIPAGTYVLSVNAGASTLTLSAAATAAGTAVVITPSTFSISVQDSGANVLETHGPYRSTTQLFADTSAYVTFSQSAGSGFTANAPSALAAAPLAGGTDASDLSDTTAVTTLNSAFPASLGPGSVSLAGYTSTTAWAGLDAHARATNRFAIKDTADQPTAAAVIAAIGSWGTTTNASYGLFTDGTVIVPGTVPSTTRTVASSAVVAALCSRVAATGNDNQMPAGIRWGLSYVSGFTSPRSDTDIASLNQAGISPWANRNGILCLYGFVTPVSPLVNEIFWQANCGRERMALVAEANLIAQPFMFQPIDGRGLLVTDFKGDLQALLTSHWAANALFGTTALDAGTVQVDTPINTPATAQIGQLNAVMNAKLTESVTSVGIQLVFFPLTAALS